MVRSGDEADDKADDKADDEAIRWLLIRNQAFVCVRSASASPTAIQRGTQVLCGCPDGLE
jgi:hypothetical protein